MATDITEFEHRLSSVEIALTKLQEQLGLSPAGTTWVEQVSGSLADIPDDDYQRFLECCHAVRSGDTDGATGTGVMKYLLDTDHLSILQRQSGPEYHRLSTWMAQFAAMDFACCVVSLHEQLLGAHNFLNQAKSTAGLIRGYQLLERLPRDYIAFTCLHFDAPCGVIYDGLISQNLRIGTMDLRLASIALTHQLTVLTRNARDFGRVVGLNIQDRTA